MSFENLIELENNKKLGAVLNFMVKNPESRFKIDKTKDGKFTLAFSTIHELFIKNNYEGDYNNIKCLTDFWFNVDENKNHKISIIPIRQDLIKHYRYSIPHNIKQVEFDWCSQFNKKHFEALTDEEFDKEIGFRTKESIRNIMEYYWLEYINPWDHYDYENEDKPSLELFKIDKHGEFGDNIYVKVTYKLPDWIIDLWQPKPKKDKRKYSKKFNTKLKNKIKKRDGNKCMEPSCENINDELHIHHIDYDKYNNDENNLITLCCSCHGKSNRDRKWHESWYRAIMYQRGNL